MRQRSALVALLMLGASVALPGIALAQSAIAGVVRDSSGAVLPGVTVEASSPALIEKTKSGVTQRGWSVPDRRSASRCLQRDVHAARLQHGRAREHRARSQLHGADQRRDADRLARGEHHRHRREPGGGRADERPSRSRLGGVDRVASHGPQLSAPGRHRSGRQHRRVRRRRIEHDVDRRQPADARVADA